MSVWNYVRCERSVPYNYCRTEILSLMKSRWVVAVVIADGDCGERCLVPGEEFERPRIELMRANVVE